VAFLFLGVGRSPDKHNLLWPEYLAIGVGLSAVRGTCFHP